MIEIRAERCGDGSIDVSGSMRGEADDVLAELAALNADILMELSLRYDGEDDILGPLERALAAQIAAELRAMTGQEEEG